MPKGADKLCDHAYVFAALIEKSSKILNPEIKRICVNGRKLAGLERELKNVFSRRDSYN